MAERRLHAIIDPVADRVILMDARGAGRRIIASIETSWLSIVVLPMAPRGERRDAA
jgi:hypothetical protein